MIHSEQKCANFCSEWSILGNGTGACWDLGIRSIFFIFCCAFCSGLNTSNEYSQLRINSRNATSLDVYCVRCCGLSTCLLHACWLSELLSILKISALNITRWYTLPGYYNGMTLVRLSSHNKFPISHFYCWTAEIILCMCPANERWRYIVTSSPIGWAHTQNDPWVRSQFSFIDTME